MNNFQTSLRRELDETTAKISKVTVDFDDLKEKMNEKMDENSRKVRTFDANAVSRIRALRLKILFGFKNT